MPASRAWLPVAFALCWFAPVVAGLTPRPLTEQVPVDRLIANLERAVAENSVDVERFINLARAHAMAFSSKSPSLAVESGKERNGAYFPADGPHLPFASVRTIADSVAEKQAQAHIAAAVASYEWALRINPFNTVARLGYGWCLQQSGDTQEAIREYRRVIEEEWPRERDSRAFQGLKGAITIETVGYLIPLLDPERDSAEIARLRGYAGELAKRPRLISPLAIPLEPSVSVEQMVDRQARVKFDADGWDLGQSWSWIRPQAGWLVYDQAGDERITSALQLFGNVTFWMFWTNGYEALCALDDDGSGDLRGKELQHLSVWRDGNSNGVSETREVRPVGAHGIVALSCAHQTEDESDDYIAMSPRGVTFADGSTRVTYDVLLHRQ